MDNRYLESFKKNFSREADEHVFHMEYQKLLATLLLGYAILGMNDKDSPEVAEIRKMVEDCKDLSALKPALLLKMPTTLQDSLRKDIDDLCELLKKHEQDKLTHGLHRRVVRVIAAIEFANDTFNPKGILHNIIGCVEYDEPLKTSLESFLPDVIPASKRKTPKPYTESYMDVRRLLELLEINPRVTDQHSCEVLKKELDYLTKKLRFDYDWKEGMTSMDAYNQMVNLGVPQEDLCSIYDDDRAGMAKIAAARLYIDDLCKFIQEEDVSAETFVQSLYGYEQTIENDVMESIKSNDFDAIRNNRE